MKALVLRVVGAGPLPWQGNWLLVLLGYVAIALLALY